jgi:hypothetical protein
MPAIEIGQPAQGVLFSEGFGNTYHVGAGSFGGAFGVGTIPGTSLEVSGGDVDILGIKNGMNGKCLANPNGNCLDLIGNTGLGAIQAIPAFDLDPRFTYTVQFTAISQDGKSNLHFLVALGSMKWDVVSTPKAQKFVLRYTPTALELQSPLSFASVTNVDNQNGPVLSGIVLCNHKIGTTNLTCPVPKP